MKLAYFFKVFDDNKISISDTSFHLLHFNVIYHNKGSDMIAGPFPIGGPYYGHGDNYRPVEPHYKKIAYALRRNLRDVRPGARIFFEDIVLSTPDGGKLHLTTPMIVYIK
ncbi:hypothetical protein GCM10023093_17410 [Nemorincola caseinilytica]|uniref:Uncharacterized protein n=2 Tax=Nemorincola caseinilytica TaxID=2054315 RepID=A0ABP8NH40_9BACT